MVAVIEYFGPNINLKKLTVVKPGTQRRDFTHVDDIARGCYLALKKGKNTDITSTKRLIWD